MRYRLHLNRAEYLAAALPFIDGAMKLFDQRRHGFSGSWWHMLMPYLLLSGPALLLVRYLYDYVELTPSSLEYQALWKHRSIPYLEIERVVPGLRVEASFVSASVTEIYVYGAKKLSLRPDRHQEFLNELKQYAPQAHFEELTAQ